MHRLLGASYASHGFPTSSAQLWHPSAFSSQSPPSDQPTAWLPPTPPNSLNKPATKVGCQAKLHEQSPACTLTCLPSSPQIKTPYQMHQSCNDPAWRPTTTRKITLEPALERCTSRPLLKLILFQAKCLPPPPTAAVASPSATPRPALAYPAPPNTLFPSLFLSHNINHHSSSLGTPSCPPASRRK